MSYRKDYRKNNRFDSMVLEQVRSLCIITFFEQYRGFTFIRNGSTFRCKQHPSLAVKDDQRSWYWHSKGIGGYGALDYLIKVENMPFREAVKAVEPYLFITVIVDDEAGPESEYAPGPELSPRAIVPTPQQYKTSTVQQPKTPNAQQAKTLILPEKAAMPLRLHKYLCNRRGIDSDIVNALIQKGMLYEDRRGNVVFVGHDEYGKPRFASLRGTYGDCSFRGDCAGSDKRYGFSVTAYVPSERLYIFESAIDLMSHASLANAEVGDKTAWARHHRLSLAGTSDAAIPFFLNQHKTVKELVFCFDNDPAGREAAVQMARKYAAMGYVTKNEPPQGKDFNEDLQAYRRHMQAKKRPISNIHDTSL